MQKAALVAHIYSLLQQRIEASEAGIASMRDAFTNETKSSAGDKHEVSRAMVQQELDKLEVQHAKLVSLQLELARVPIDRTYDRVAFGSLVGTDNGIYFIAIGLGAIEVNGGTCYAISLASPIGKSLNGKKVGDRVTFNGRTLSIHAIL